MTFDRIFWFGLTLFWTVLVAAMLATFPSKARADHVGHPPEHMYLHEQFYTNWNRPDMRDQETGDRKHSCCNNLDCAPVDRIEYRADGTVWALRTKDQQWVKIPEAKIESNQIDPRESPDGRSHMCSSGSMVFCFVLGSAT